MPQNRWFLVVCLVVGVLAGCSGDDSATPTGDDADRASADDGSPPARFCDVYLDYLADSTPANLTAVVAASDDPQVEEYADTIAADPDIDALIAATLDLDDLARLDCQPEWTAGAQGAGNTGAAAQAFFDAVVAGDRIGARNIASANAIAVFEPWAPVEPDDAAGTPALADVGGQSFSLALGPASVAQCEVETGVVVACQLAE